MRSYLLFSIFCIVLNINAQTKNSQYFDDNDISISKNVLKFNLTSLYFRYAEVSWERVISKDISIEGSFSTHFDYQPKFPHNIELFNDFPDGEIDSKEIKKGHEIKIGIKYYPFGFTTEDSYLEMKHIWGTFSSTEEVYRVKNFEFISGRQFDLFPRVYIDLYVGLGFFYDSDDFVDLANEDANFYVPIGVKIGYAF